MIVSIVTLLASILSSIYCQILHFNDPPPVEISYESLESELLMEDPIPFPSGQDFFPVVFVHGLGGSRLYVQNTGYSYPANLQNSESRASRYWGWMNQSTADNTCYFHLPKLGANGRPLDNVTVTAVDNKFGDTDSVQCLTEATKTNWRCTITKRTKAGYVQRLFEVKSKWGYRQGDTLLAATYDSRHMPSSEHLDAFYANLTTLVESAVKRTGRKVITMGHPNGNIVMAHFLHSKTKAWCDRHIQKVVTVAAPFGGSVPALYDLLVPVLRFHDTDETVPSLQTHTFSNGEEVCVSRVPIRECPARTNPSRVSPVAVPFICFSSAEKLPMPPGVEIWHMTSPEYDSHFRAVTVNIPEACY